MKCEICGREQESLCSIKGYHVCNKHYQQFFKYGKFLDNNPLTTKDPNIIKIEGDIAIIELRNSKQELQCEAIIDKEDVDKVKCYKWRWSKSTSMVLTGNGQTNVAIPLHRLITNCPKGKYVDHINMDRLDNRKCNLRICTNQENQFNKTKTKANTSGFKGVWFDKARNKWASEIKLNYKKIFIGRFDDFNKACYSRYYAEVLLHKEFKNSFNQDDVDNLNLTETDQQQIENLVIDKLKKKSLL